MGHCCYHLQSYFYHLLILKALIFLALVNNRKSQGIPEQWFVVDDWLDERKIPPYPKNEEVTLFKKKFENIPTLADYTVIPEDSFWDNFPKRGLPSRPSTRVKVDILEEEIYLVKDKLTKSELRRAERVVKDLRYGAEAYQRNELPPISTCNAKSAYEYGELLTDKIASWIVKGFVAGPFLCPPMPGFRANPQIAVARNGKIRPVMNMSGPRGRSFNDNIDHAKLEKVNMSTAKKFSYELKKAGKDAKFSKFDIEEAYKLIPQKTEDIRLQGFTWLGKYFCETQGTFGGIGSVCNFDRLGNTKDRVVCVKSNTPRNAVLRILDDTPNVGPVDSGIAERFAKEMRDFCEKVGIPLADNCAKNDKAFELQTRGIVFGVGFDSKDMTFFLTEEKANKVIRRCMDAYRSSHLDLKQCQQLMGSVNDLAQMCPFIKFYKGSGNRLLAQFGDNNCILLQTSDQLKKDLLVISKVAESCKSGLPIADPREEPGLSNLMFYTDAAGASFTTVKGRKHFHSQLGRGAACIGGETLETIWFWSRLEWPEKFMTEMRDEKGTIFGCKSTTLESIGLTIPFTAIPERIKGRTITFMVDNIAVALGLE